MMKPYETEHIAKVRAIAPECMVLLKSDGGFPLQEPGPIALYGSGARRTIKGGTGSGDVNVRRFTTIEDGLQNAGFSITTDDWLDGYDQQWQIAHKAFTAEIKARIEAQGMAAIMLGIGAVMPEPDYELPMNGSGETAIYVLARVSGEGSDRQAVPGDFQLTSTEIRDILQLQKQYNRFLLVLNVGGVVDLSPIAEQVANILVLSQTGISIGDAFADVLLGKAYPSGKLASTWAAWADYCQVGDFGLKDDTRYREGIYVGYRYFDSIEKMPLFPFGHGLGYTTFQLSAETFSVDGPTVSVSAKIKNTGKCSGKEVVQLYVSMPPGKLDQPYQVLAAFAKTRELQGGEEQILTLDFSMDSIASFDEETACTILEAGQYVLRLGNSSRNTAVCGVVELDESVKLQQLSRSGGNPDFTDWKPENPKVSIVPETAPVRKMRAANCQVKPAQKPITDPKALEIVRSLTDSELALLCVGGFVDNGNNSFIGNAGLTVAGAAGETTSEFTGQGIPALVMADGPAGLRLSRQYGVDEQGIYTVDEGSFATLFEMLPESLMTALHLDNTDNAERNGTIYEQYCTAIPIGTALAQSWNVQLVQACGDLVGAEMERFGVHLWLAPALNIHRSPLCGRNFEYYSEDPLISGKMAAAITRGTQQHPGCGTTIKHLAGNNQETNRFHSNSEISQRALRDIYLKGFQIAVAESSPKAVMSSYNLLNGEHTSQREDLLETILRDEWGYAGIVMSDWVSGNASIFDAGNKYPGACSSGSIKAGNDIMMPGSKAHTDDLLGALDNQSASYPLTRANLEKCAARMVAMSLQLSRDRLPGHDDQMENNNHEVR